MLRDLLNGIAGLAVAAQAPTVLRDDETPDRFWISRGNELELVTIPPPRRAHELAGLDDLLRAVLDPAIGKAPEVYFTGERVVALLNRDERVETVSLELRRSARWHTLSDLAQKPRTLAPSQAVRLLRFELHGTGVDSLVTELGRVDFARKADGAHSIAHGRESLGKAVEASVQQIDRIPESFSVEVAPIVTPGLRSFRGSVRCGVYVDLAAEGFVIQPLADELETLEVALLEHTREALRDSLGSDFPLFAGTP